MLTNNQKYQQLKAHILHDFPEIRWSEHQSDDDQALTGLDYSGHLPPELAVFYKNSRHMPFVAIAHEIGHYLSFLAGNHNQSLLFAHRVQNSGGEFVGMKNRIYQEESLATKLGKKYTEEHGLFFSREDMMEMRRALATYE